MDGQDDQASARVSRAAIAVGVPCKLGRMSCQRFRGAPLGLYVFPGISGAGRGPEQGRSTSLFQGDPSGCASQATSSITDGVVSTAAGFPNALPLRSWITWQARSSAGRCADEGNASLRASTSAGAGLRPAVQADRTRKAVSTSSLGFIDRLPAGSNTDPSSSGTRCQADGHRPGRRCKRQARGTRHRPGL